MEGLSISSGDVSVADQIGTDHEGALALSQTLQSNKILKWLLLRNDQSIGEAGARAFVQYNHTLERLLLCQNYSHHFPPEELNSRVHLL